MFAGLTALSWSAGSLIAFRTLGAATGAAVGPASIAIINRLFPRERRVQAMGYWSMVGAGGPVIGVVAGGPIVETFGWRWIFVAQVPLTLAGLLLALLVLPETERRERHALRRRRRRRSSRSAPPRSCSPSTAGRAVGLVEPGDRRRLRRRAAGARGVRRWSSGGSAHPLLPLAYLRRRNFSFAIATQFFTNFAYMGGFVITPLFLESVFGYPETQRRRPDDRPAARLRHRRPARRLRGRPGRGAHVGGGRRRASWWRRWWRCRRSRPGRPTS